MSKALRTPEYCVIAGTVRSACSPPGLSKSYVRYTCEERLPRNASGIGAAELKWVALTWQTLHSFQKHAKIPGPTPLRSQGFGPLRRQLPKVSNLGAVLVTSGAANIYEPLYTRLWESAKICAAVARCGSAVRMSSRMEVKQSCARMR